MIASHLAMISPTSALGAGMNWLSMPWAAASLGDSDALLNAIGNGFSHIVPEGSDHVLFLLGLFFLSRSLPALLLQTTLFTLAHSFTLGVVVITGLALPMHWVEVAVGISIAVVVLENFFPAQLRPWRSYLVAIFGSIHGLAFAHNIILSPQAKENPIIRLLGFNVGVELGQLVVIGAACLCFQPLWSRGWYERRIAWPASITISLIGLAWALQRGFAAGS